MAAPSLKSGTGHTLITQGAQDILTPDLYTIAPSHFVLQPDGISGHAESSNVRAALFNPSVKGAYRGGKQNDFSAFSCGAEGHVVTLHTAYSSVTAAYNSETCANSAVIVTLRSTTGNSRTWAIDGSDHNPLSMDYAACIIDPRYTGTQFRADGTLDTSSISQIEYHAYGINDSSHYGDISTKISRAYLVSPYVVINGTSGTPATIAVIHAALDANGNRLRTSPRASASIAQLMFSYHIGDGTTFTYAAETGKTFIFPSTSNAANKYLKAHIPPGHIGIKFTGGAASTCLFTNCTTIGPHYFRMVAASGDTNIISGCSINNATEVVLSAYTTVTNTAFIACATVPLTSGPTVNSMTITSTTGTYGVDCGANTTINNVTFNAAGSSDYAIKISPTATGSFTVTSCTFNGYASGKKIYVNDANAAHTITISGSGIVEADITSAGAVVVVPSVATAVEHDSLPSGTRYIIHVDNGSGEVELANAKCVGTGFNVSIPSGISTGDTLILRTAYQSGLTVQKGGPWRITATEGVTNSFSTNTPDTIAEFAEWGFDGSLLPELETDFDNIEAEITPTGDVDYPTAKVLSFIAYAAAEEADGIRYWHGAYTVLDSANVRLHIGLKIVNTMAATSNVRLTGNIYIVRDDGENFAGNGINLQVGKVYVQNVNLGSGMSTAEHNALMDLATNYTSTRAGYIDQIPTARKLLQNKRITNPATGTQTVYNDDGSPMLSGAVYNDAAGLEPYDGTGGIDRQDRLA